MEERCGKYSDLFPYKDTIIEKINAKAGVEVVQGTHPYLPNNIFA